MLTCVLFLDPYSSRPASRKSQPPPEDDDQLYAEQLRKLQQLSQPTDAPPRTTGKVLSHSSFSLIKFYKNYRLCRILCGRSLLHACRERDWLPCWPPGVTPEVNLRTSMQARKLTSEGSILALKSRQTSP